MDKEIYIKEYISMVNEIDLENIERLKWDPYIGKNYFKNKHRILVIGESHYKDANGKYKEKNFTDYIVNGHAIKGKNYSKLFPSFHKALFGETQINKQSLWYNLSFYNFVQRPMDTNEIRPSKDDFYKGWLTFFKIVEVLKPTHCIFLGVSAIKTLKKANSFEENIQIINPIRYSQIQRTFPRKLSISINEITSKVVFIKHPSQFFSWSKWNGFLQQEMKEELNWLKCFVIE